VAKTERFEIILDECLEHLLTGTETIEQCLQRYPEYAGELEPLLRTAMSFNRAVDIKPSPEIKARGRYRLQIAIAKEKTPRHVSFWKWQPRWTMAVGVVLVLFILGSGTVLAAGPSLPGSPFYSVKLATENIRVKLTGSEVKKATLYAEFADKRMSEMIRMVENGNLANIDIVAQQLNADIILISNLPLEEQPLMTGTMMATGQGTIEQAAPAMSFGSRNLETTVPTTITAPVVPAPEIALAPEITVMKGANSEATLAEDSNAIPTNDREKLKKVIAGLASRHPEILRQMLDSDKIPEDVKPSIRRALWASEHGYQEALQKLDR
jgi:hypothetical protein